MWVLDLDVINNNYTRDGSPPYLRVDEINNTDLFDGNRAEYLYCRERVNSRNNNHLYRIPTRHCPRCLKGRRGGVQFRIGIDRVVRAGSIDTFSMPY